jgi:1-phosphofructokinase
MIVTVTLTPALDKTVVLPGFAVDQVNRIQSLRLDAGGKGINVSKVLKALGTDSLATGILGGGTGRYIENALQEMGIACDFAWVPQDTRTNLKVIDPVGHTNTDINEPGAPVSEEVLESVFEKAAAAANPGDIVVLAGKAPAGTADTIFADWITRFKTRGIKVYMDADAALLIAGAKACPAMIKPNDAELGRLLGRSFSGIADLAAAAKELVEGGIETVVVSLGGDGALFVTKNEVLRGKGLRVPVQSTVGAGDSMMATMAHGAVSGISFRDTCALAMAVSAATVMTPGTQAADMNVVRELLPKVELETL